jgi:hypothetical protein
MPNQRPHASRTSEPQRSPKAAVEEGRKAKYRGEKMKDRQRQQQTRGPTVRNRGGPQGRKDQTSSGSSDQLRCRALSARSSWTRREPQCGRRSRAFGAGRTTTAKADAYERYIYEGGIKPLEDKALARPIATRGSCRRERVQHDLLLGERAGHGALCRGRTRRASTTWNEIRNSSSNCRVGVQILRILTSHGVFGA